MSPHNKSRSSSDGLKNMSANLSQDIDDPTTANAGGSRPRSSSSDAKLPSVGRNLNASQGSDCSYPSQHLNRRTHDTAGTHSPDNDFSRRLQTINSGIALDSLHTNQHSPSPLKTNHSPKCPCYQNYHDSPPLPPTPRKTFLTNAHGGHSWKESNNQNIDSEFLENPHATHRSQNSHYSVDAGKHGFLSNSYIHRMSQSSDGNDSDSAVDSIIFHYTPGEETPPAEYALPAAILKVYGEDCEYHKEESDLTSSLLSLESGLPIEHENKVHQGMAERMANNQKQKPITAVDDEIFQHNYIPSFRLELLPPSLSDRRENREADQNRILPYHERKRLTQLNEMHKQTNNKEGKAVSSKIRGPKEPSISGVIKTAADEQSSLLHSKTSDNVQDYPRNHLQLTLLTKLSTIFAGKSSQRVTPMQDWQPNQAKQHKPYGSVEDAIRSYRDRGQAFLRRTEKERIKLKEQCRADELNNVTTPVSRQHNCGHSRGKISSLSNALDSIASCSDDDDKPTSSDEETGSSYNDENSQSKTPQRNHKVWNYGEPSVTSTEITIVSKSERNLERKRLLQEDYEFRVCGRSRENELVTKKFRLLVLVTVAFILVAGLAFAFVVCMKILFSS